MKQSNLDPLHIETAVICMATGHYDGPNVWPWTLNHGHPYHKVREYFVYRDGHGLGSMAAQHCFSFNMQRI